MGIFLTIIHVISCLLLILVILLQAGRGQGLTSAAFGSGNVQSLLGTRTGDFLTKATTVAAICFLVTCIGLDILEARKSRSLLRGPSTQAPLDIEQIKKALEKIKAETPAKVDAAAQGLEKTAAEAGSTVTAQANALKETAKEGVQDAKAAASEAVNAMAVQAAEVKQAVAKQVSAAKTAEVKLDAVAEDAAKKDAAKTPQAAAQ